MSEYAQVQTRDVNTVKKRFLGLTDIQIGLFSLPTLIFLSSIVLFVLNRKARFNPVIIVGLIVGLIHLYHHYTLAKLQNKQ